MSSNVYWRPIGFSCLRIEEWNEEFTLYQPDSGKTHFLNQTGMQIILNLAQSPASTDDICQNLAAQFELCLNQQFSQQIISILNRFNELGLVEKIERESSM